MDSILNPDLVAAGYSTTSDLTGGGSVQIFPGFGEVNLKTLTAERADQLIAGGFKWLAKAEKAKPAKAAAEAEKAKPAKAAAEAEKAKAAEAEAPAESGDAPTE